MDGDRLLTPSEVAARLQVSGAKARELIRSGAIQSIQFSERVVRVPESALFIGKSAGGAGAEIPALVPAIPIPSIPVSSTHTHAHNSESA
jgi:excisionase family DNA binding protein